MIKKAIINFFKGIAIGIGMIVPGFGGGTTAIVLGVYSDLISAVANIFKPTKRKNNFSFYNRIRSCRRYSVAVQSNSMDD